ncbi:eukaryotic mitochondrial regulator protein-domain-containing protein [Amylocarpus encephaloides]|uniref:Eukaryotic mitochondrial regulator protein-domain-containing protein n=1 Tax=Amylocarpus encephaloides TaxID=45428 RepID=A0A9P8C4B0_9HELO|nr:eukaryotic mitochondrial regulator protein-domain-containing protein [Amylocarpus encephaloides]
MPPTLRCATSTSRCVRELCKASQSLRSFSTTPRCDQRTTRARRAMWRWLQQQGANLRDPLEGGTNYLGAYNKDGKLLRVMRAERNQESERAVEQSEPKNAERDPDAKQAGVKVPEETVSDRIPFPLNRNFISEPVLSENFREEIWYRIMKLGHSVREVSAELGVEMSRVGAVVRLKEVEFEWKRIGKPLVVPYANAVMSMLPKTDYNPEEKDPKRRRPHESINDLPVHASTAQQIFYPTSESREFSRADAAKVFNERLKPADDRIPHPQLVLQHREKFVERLTDQEIAERAREREAIAEKKQHRAAMIQLSKDAKTKKIESGRWEFRFTDANVDAAGKDGRGHKGVGWRYGVPHYDRNRGLIKIPKTVGA